VKRVGGLGRQHGGQYLAVGHLSPPQKLTQGRGGFHRKLAASHRGKTHCAGVARRKGYSRNNNAGSPERTNGREEPMEGP
jgi:hypothetical protein